MLGIKKAERAAVKNNTDGSVNSDKRTHNTKTMKEKINMMNPVTAATKIANDHKYSKYGFNDEKYTKPLANGTISRCVVQFPIDPAAVSIAKDYCGSLANHEFKNIYFNEKEDRKVFKMINKFYEGNIGTQGYECNILDITRIMNIARRAVIGISFKSEFYNRSLKRSYFEDKSFGGINVLKLMAWGVTHAYCTGLFLSTKNMFDVIPKTKREIQTIWNAYINCQDDIRDEVKNLFTFNEDGVCKFVEDKKETFCTFGKKQSPTDDIPFDEAADASVIPLLPTVVINGNRELDNEYHIAISKPDKIIDAEYTVVEDVKKDNSTSEVTMKPNIDNPAEKTPTIAHEVVTASESTKDDDGYEYFSEDDSKPGDQMTFGELIASQIEKGNTINPAVIASVMSEKDNINAMNLADVVKSNNSQWSEIPRLSKFTSYVQEVGKNVLYAMDKDFLGLIDAKIIDNDGNITRELHIDPCLMYGDTLRIITTDNVKGDIRRETFIPISNKEIVTAAINGPLTKDQRKTIVSALPRCLGDFRTKYSFLDKVDMRGIFDPKKSDINGLAFEDWRALVTNISNILKIKGFPICRMRISEYRDPDNFQLTCDDKVYSTYPSAILTEPSNMNAMQNRFFINATSDPTKKDLPNIYYTGPDYSEAVGKKD